MKIHRLLLVFLIPLLTSFALTPPTIVLGNQTVTMTVTVVSGEPVTYQWYKGTTPIAGATKNTLTVSALTSATYQAHVKNAAGVTKSGYVKVGVTAVIDSAEIAITTKK